MGTQPAATSTRASAGTGRSSSRRRRSRLSPGLGQREETPRWCLPIGTQRRKAPASIGAPDHGAMQAGSSCHVCAAPALHGTPDRLANELVRTDIPDNPARRKCHQAPGCHPPSVPSSPISRYLRRTGRKNTFPWSYDNSDTRFPPLTYALHPMGTSPFPEHGPQNHDFLRNHPSQTPKIAACGAPGRYPSGAGRRRRPPTQP